MTDIPGALPHPHPPTNGGGDGPPPPPALPRSRWRWAMRMVAAFLALLLLAIAWLAVTAPLSRSLQPIAPPSITLLANNGAPIARTGSIIDQPVRIADLPPHVPQAFIAIEDRRFRTHWGIDPRGIARAAWVNMRAGAARQGGSTITQQLAKGVFLTADRTAARKMREALIALWLEAWLTKDQILERYLSNVYFGDNVYGLRAASLHYFNRRPERLTLAQAAMLAGLLKAPSRLAPTSNLAGARERARIVIGAMVREGYVEPARAAALPPARLDVRVMRERMGGTWFADWVLAQARDRAGAVYGEQEIVTTLDPRLQHLAEASARRAPLGGAQVAIITMKPDGTVLAMVGGRSYRQSSFNRATQAMRQPGSTFKLFVYLAAIRAGKTPDDMIDDSPIVTGPYRPENHDKRYLGRITLRRAFAVSSNVAAVRLAEQTGLRNVVGAARMLGVTAPLHTHPSLALGTSEMTLIELTQAYAAIASGEYPVRARGLPQREASWIAALLDDRHPFPAQQVDMMRDLLSSATRGGTGRAAALRARTFGKTGTSQNSRDALFIGYAGGLVTGVWVGHDDGRPLPGGASGGGLPARLWRDYMRRATGDARPADKSQDRPAAPALDIDMVNAIANVSVDSPVGPLDIRVDGDGVDIGINITAPAAPDTSTPTPDTP